MYTYLKYPLQQQQQPPTRHTQNAHGKGRVKIHPQRKPRYGGGRIDPAKQRKAQKGIEQHPPHNLKRGGKHADHHRDKKQNCACQRRHFPYPIAFTPNALISRMR